MRFYDTIQAENGEGHFCFILEGKTQSHLHHFQSTISSESWKDSPLWFCAANRTNWDYEYFWPLGDWRRCGHKLRYKRWWLEIFLGFIPVLGKWWSHLTIEYFFRWVVQPRTCTFFAQPSNWRGFLSEPKTLFGWINHKLMFFLGGNDLFSDTSFWDASNPFHVIDFGRKMGPPTSQIVKVWGFDGFWRGFFLPFPSLHGKQNLRINPVNPSWKGFLGVFLFMWVKNEGYKPWKYGLWSLNMKVVGSHIICFYFFLCGFQKTYPVIFWGAIRVTMDDVFSYYMRS